MIIEIVKFFIFSFLIVFISKVILVKALRELAENLKLKAKTVGNVAGLATSVPELLTISISSIKGLASASIYNILSSNVINLIQYISTIILNKNTKKLKNNAIKTDIILVILTIAIPLFFLRLNIKLNKSLVPLFIILYVFFIFLNNNAHKQYLSKKEKESINENNYRKSSKMVTIKNIIIILFTGISLFIISQLLGNTLETLCKAFRNI